MVDLGSLILKTNKNSVKLTCDEANRKYVYQLIHTNCHFLSVYSLLHVLANCEPSSGIFINIDTGKTISALSWRSPISH